VTWDIQANDDFQAIRIFREGLKTYAETNYRDFIVPWMEHYGKRIRECRDKEFFEDVLYQYSGDGPDSEYGIILIAIENFLNDPHHQGVKRDIGELLARSKRSDELNLLNGNEEVPTLSDEEAMDDREEDELTEHEDGVISHTGATTDEDLEEEDENNVKEETDASSVKLEEDEEEDEDNVKEETDVSSVKLEEDEEEMKKEARLADNEADNEIKEDPGDGSEIDIKRELDEDMDRETEENHPEDENGGQIESGSDRRSEAINSSRARQRIEDSEFIVDDSDNDNDSDAFKDADPSSSSSESDSDCYSVESESALSQTGSTTHNRRSRSVSTAPTSDSDEVDASEAGEVKDGSNGRRRHHSCAQNVTRRKRRLYRRRSTTPESVTGSIDSHEAESESDLLAKSTPRRSARLDRSQSPRKTPIKPSSSGSGTYMRRKHTRTRKLRSSSDEDFDDDDISQTRGYKPAENLNAVLITPTKKYLRSFPRSGTSGGKRKFHISGSESDGPTSPRRSRVKADEKSSSPKKRQRKKLKSDSDGLNGYALRDKDSDF
ncbi:hypothetical protein H0H93_009771, partial [Arthromyces matolae]